MNDFCNIRTDFNFIFGKFSVARKLILNGGAIRPIGLLLSFCHDFLAACGRKTDYVINMALQEKINTFK